MLPGQSAILDALAAALAARGFSDAKPALLAIEPPRDWGVTTNVCFMLAGRAAQAQIAERTAGLDKKAAKALAAEITRAAGPQLAEELVRELHESVAAASLRPSDSGTDAAATQDRLIARVEAEGAFINFYYDPVALSQQIVSDILAPERVGQAAVPVKDSEAPTSDAQTQNPGQAEPPVPLSRRYGQGEPTGRRVMVEYAQPNTHKDFHVGHLRNASIGQAIANVLEFAGNEVKKATYIGDIGAHVAKAIWWHLRHPMGVPPNGSGPADALAYWGESYQSGNAASSVEQVQQEQRAWLKAWEKGDAGARAVWQQSRDECVAAFQQIFGELGLTIDDDCWFYESTVDDTHLGQKTAAELQERGVAVVDESEEYKGALYVDFAEHADKYPEGERKRIKQLGKMTILRSDGTSLYQTKELGLAKYKFDNFAIDESLYVVGSEQKLYFEQVFAILKLWGFPNAENCRHIAYELVVLPEGKMSSREGTVVSYRELRDEAVRRATEITREKGIAGDVDKVAREVAIAAIKYAMLQVSGNQQIVFDFEQALSFDGRAAPYLQYAYARAGKLVDPLEREAPASQSGALQAAPRGSGATAPKAVAITPDVARQEPRAPLELHPSEISLARTLAAWPATAHTAALKYEPAVIANYLYELADAFNGFYRDCRVLDAPPEVKPWRQDLTRAFRAVLRTGFELLALPLPEAM